MVGEDMYWYVTVVLAVLLLAYAAAGCSGDKPEGPEKPAPVKMADKSEAAALDGKSLVEKRCSSCHGIDRIYSHKHTEAQWEQVVDRMIGKGAKLSPAEREAVLKHLSSR